MPETTATTISDRPVFPPGRYGRRREGRHPRPWLVVALALVTAAVGVLIAVRLYRLYGNPAYDAEVITYTDITDSQVVVDFRVRVPTGGSAVCLLRARARNGAQVGQAEVRVQATPGGQYATGRHRITTSARPVIGEVVRCWGADRPRTVRSLA